jgi:hypothetical protein
MTTNQLSQILDGPHSRYAVEEAILKLYNLQTDDEQESGSTKHENGAGFNGTDSRYGTSLAEWILKSYSPPGKRLTTGHDGQSGQYGAAKRMILKYHSQLSPEDILPLDASQDLPLILAQELREIVLAHSSVPGILFDWQSYLTEDPTAGDKIISALQEAIEFHLKTVTVTKGK